MTGEFLTRQRLSEQFRSLPVHTWHSIPAHLNVGSRWKKQGRKVRTNEEPVALVRWTETRKKRSQEFNCDGTTTWTETPETVVRYAGLFSSEQTQPYKGSRRGWSVELFNKYFRELSSSDQFIWWFDNHWISCGGKLKEWHLKSHLKGESVYGIRGGKQTRFGAIDLDLHNGDRQVFLDQFRVLLGELHGKDGWHFHVSNENAGGVHLIQVLRDAVQTEGYRYRLRTQLRELDAKYPELAQRAKDAGMATLAELEVFPDPKRGFRLPLCKGRTMLLDKPLELVRNNRMKHKPLIPDVVEYVSWVVDSDRLYMPADEVFAYVEERLQEPAAIEKKVAKNSKKKKPPKATSDGMSSLGKMKGRYASVLIDFWKGNCPHDSLNKGIRLLALMLPFYINDEDDAVELIEGYIDDLPDDAFSDRLSSGDRDEVSRIVRSTVKKVYDGFGGQPNPEVSKKKLEQTFHAWQRRGFNPTNKSTWNKVGGRITLATTFCWAPQEIVRMTEIQDLLKSDLETTCKVVKHLVRLVKGHSGEIAVGFVKKILNEFGIACGSRGANKANNLLRMLREWGWIYMRASEKWHFVDEAGHKKGGRARAYGIGEELKGKFKTSRKSSTAMPSADLAGPYGPARRMTLLRNRAPQRLPGIGGERRVSIYCAPSLSPLSQKKVPAWLLSLAQEARGSP
ncbi:MAG: hypothetical protein HQ567_17400 [Candidatus Nealsonbacteria bacterium]|nr:hypothetical protein [Candidatus Nealsonbacteria bacterium]